MEWLSNFLLWISLMVTGNLVLAMGFITVRDAFKKKWWLTSSSIIFLLILVWVHLIVIQSFIR